MTQRPNIVLLVGEDTGLHLGCYGTPEARTPNLDRLAAEGGRYTNAFSTGPVCAPSRCALVTGCYAWSIGGHHMRSTLLAPPRMFTQELRAAGYHVAWPGKTDFNFDPPAGFADTTDDWGARLPAAPFFAFCNLGITHESSMWDRTPHEQRGYDDWIRQLPEAQHTDPAAVRVPPYLPDVLETRREIARYFNALALQDLEVGRRLALIDQGPHRDNTIVIYLTDHGRGLPREKRWCYDAGLHLPLIIRWPGGIAPGTVEERLVSWVDIAPTILSLAGVPILDHYQGHAFLGPAEAAPRTHVFGGRDRMDEAFDHVRIARDRRFHYIRNGYPHLPYAQRVRYMENEQTMQALRRLDAAGELSPPADVFMQRTKPVEELYDSQADPDMVHNLAGTAAHAGVLAELRAALDENRGRYGDLGLVPESELIARGLVKDRLTDEYSSRLAPLPEPFAVRTGETVLTMEEAEALRPLEHG